MNKKMTNAGYNMVAGLPSNIESVPLSPCPTAIELSLLKKPAVSPPSPPLEERAGERRPFNAPHANSMVVQTLPLWGLRERRIGRGTIQASFFQGGTVLFVVITTG